MVQKWSVSYPAYTGYEPRNVYVYLPTMYEYESELRYPVLYMFDGHNVFFDKDATYGKSWGLGRYLDYTDTPLIVVAVECNHSPENGRLSEYSPYDFEDPHLGRFIGRGKETMEWFIRVLKPQIDREFRTIPDRDHTFIMGSSMGGLMSLYAVLRYNKVFSRAAALSPSIWVAPERLCELVRRTPISPDTVIYMDYGSREMGFHAEMERFFMQLGEQILSRRIHLTLRIVPNGDHSEASWEKQLPFCIGALMYGMEDEA
ncbi:alpha/beta hydrolase [Anaeromassilibacillus senegalensis]|uniref:Alpha/beta hydrolase n=1 Tax=Anaeromassilibacillus senegalensis TaxID=1673717 RepID=A0ABS9CPQ1_9FIRM|nr:alpha/beta hydrolase-fold protein [Anaeromassilibacillus senegalensis]MCF2652320.1 alpha/beta hydrolase [Anaeromassilibacillus senegalensis]